MNFDPINPYYNELRKENQKLIDENKELKEENERLKSEVAAHGELGKSRYGSLTE